MSVGLAVTVAGTVVLLIFAVIIGCWDERRAKEIRSNRGFLKGIDTPITREKDRLSAEEGQHGREEDKG